MMQCSCLHAKGCSWLAVVHGYEVFFIPTKCFIRKKLTFRLLFCSLHQSIHSMHKTLLCCSDDDCRIAVETSAFFLIKHLVGVKDTS